MTLLCTIYLGNKIETDKMTVNLASGPINMVNELVFIRLYIKSTNGQTLEYARGTQRGEIYRPSDDLESMLYEYRSWLLETNPRELALKEVPGLFPIPSLSWMLVDYLVMTYRATRWGEVSRESWAKLVAKCAGGLSLVDGDVTLTREEASWVNRFDIWSGSIEVDVCDNRVRVEFVIREETVTEPDERYIGRLGVKGLGDVDKRAYIVALRSISGYSLTECRHALEASGWDITVADNWLKGRR